MSNHQWTGADVLDDPDHLYYSDALGTTYYWQVDTTSDSSYAQPQVDAPSNFAGYYTMWLKYTPTTDQGLIVNAFDASSGNAVTVGVWTRTGATWNTIVAPGNNNVTAQVSAGKTYYLAYSYVAQNAGGGGILVGFGTTQRPASDLNAVVPPTRITVRSWPRVVGEADEADTTVAVSVTVGPFVEDTGIPIPAIRIKAAAGVPAAFSTNLHLSSPLDQSVVASATPDFTVAVVTDDDEAIYTIEVQYADDSGFANPVTIAVQAEAVDGGAILTPASAVPATTFWRARLLQNGAVLIGWTAAQSFTVNTTISTMTVPVTWTVSTSATRPVHLWHIDPPGPLTGDTVTIYGQGFPASGHLAFGDDTLPVLTWELVEATAAESTDTRTIDGPTVDPEHYEVTFTAPVYNGPGAALSVEA